MAGSYIQVAASIAVGRNVSHMTGLAESENIGRAPTTSRVPYPNPCDGGAYLSPVWVHEASKALRGHIPGLWALAAAASRPFTQGDVIDGGGAMAGRKFMAWNTARNASGVDAQVLIEISNTWYS